MQLLKTVPFSFAGKDYEIRVACDGMKVVVQTYSDNKPANGYSYEVTLVKSIDFKMQIGLDVVQRLIDIAKSDVMEGRWEGYLEAVKSLENK